MSTLHSVSRLKILPADTKLKFPVRIKESLMGQNANTNISTRLTPKYIVLTTVISLSGVFTLLGQLRACYFDRE